MNRRLIACTSCTEMVFEGSCVCPHCGHKYPCRSRALPAAALLAGLVLGTGCEKLLPQSEYGVLVTDPHVPEKEVDNDGDGFGSYSDCDDDDPELNWHDKDGDGYTTCTDDCDDKNTALNPVDYDMDGWSTCEGDCDDADPDRYPDAYETPDDGVDQNCDGEDNP